MERGDAKESLDSCTRQRVGFHAEFLVWEEKGVLAEKEFLRYRALLGVCDLCPSGMTNEVLFP